MTPERWQRIKDLLYQAQQLKAEERSAFLDRSCSSDRSLRDEVETLLFSSDQARSSFLESSPAQLTVMPGTRLGDYEVQKLLGSGGMGEVYRARDLRLRRDVAIKVLPSFLSSDKERLRRFEQEAQAAAALNHHNILAVHQMGTYEGARYLVSELLEGGTLREQIVRGPIPVHKAIDHGVQIARGLAAAHQKGIVHRDLKPENLFITEDGRVKILDFGLAKLTQPQSGSEHSAPTVAGETGPGAVMGTVGYMSPEQVRGQTVDHRTDIFSFGAILYEMLAGQRAFQKPTSAETMTAILNEDPPSISQVTTSIPPALQRVVHRCLEKNPEQRFQSASDLAFALNALSDSSQDIERHLRHLPVVARPSTLAYRATKFVQRHKIEVSAALAIAVALLAALFLALNSFGVRGRFFGTTFQMAMQSLTPTRSFKPKGWGTAGGAGASPIVGCESMASLKLPNTTILSAHSIVDGSFVPPRSDPILNLPSFCRIEAALRPTAESDIRFELWMPSNGWNRKFRGVGNGGFGGYINYDDMAPAVRNGYATASTDTGHLGDDRDDTWALRHREKVIDFGYRAIHEMTEASKAIVRSYYGQSLQWSFFEGCSNGGREALMEAQRFPEDYQGILAGAPAIPATRLLTSALYTAPTSSPAYIPQSKIPAISAAVLAACDAQDGVVDGILNDPRQCHFDPAVLLCHGADSESCLTAPQVAQLKKIYEGLKNSKGEQLYPGYLPGGEEGDDGWTLWLTGSAPGQGLMSIYGINYFRNMVFENVTWNYRMISPEKSAAIAEVKTGRIMDATDPDLRRFKAQGGKLILYHGWSDAGMSALVSTDYYDKLEATMGPEATHNFARLYMAPGMQHCYGGSGPNSFGQIDLSSLGAKSAPPTNLDPKYNISSALEKWLTDGTAPGPIIATKFVNDLDPAEGVKMTRPLCPYPQFAKYKGTGDTNDAGNFVCTDNN